MMIIMKEGATGAQIDDVVDRLHAVGAEAHIHHGDPVTIAVEGDRE